MKYDNCLHINVCRHVILENCVDGCRGKHYEPRNLAKPEASDAVLSEVRAMKQKNNGYEEIGYGDLYVDGYNKAIDDVLQKLNAHFR